MEWIDINDRLPEVATQGCIDVLCLTKYKSATIVLSFYPSYRGSANRFYNTEKRIGKDDFEDWTEHIIKWQPLPKSLTKSIYDLSDMD